MNTGERRGEILKILKQTEVPIAARELAGRFGVSRQVLVQDLAVIRASTPGILSTTKGYVMGIQSTSQSGQSSTGAESERGLRRTCKKYQHQSQGLRACQCGDGYPLKTGCQ